MEYLDGNLGDSERQIFEQHMRDCPPCEVYLETYGETIKLGQDAFWPAEGALPDDVPEELVQAILAARSKSP